MAEENKANEFKAPKIPTGKKLVGARAFCPKHGEVTQAIQYVEYTRIDTREDGTKVAVHVPDMICKACYSEWIRSQVEAGVFGKVSTTPIFGPDIKALAPLACKGAVKTIDEVSLKEKGEYVIYDGEEATKLTNGDDIKRGMWIICTGANTGNDEDQYVAYAPTLAVDED